MRLTLKNKEIRDNFNAEYAKLADLEDIEDELGIDLITLFKALKNGIYYKNDRGKIVYSEHPVVEFNKDTNLYCFQPSFWNWDVKYFKDYGKTWALTKEELL